MKEIEKVSIAGISFMLDKDAFGKLKGYLSGVEEAYRNDPDGDEIVSDIEARIAEIILSRQDPGAIVSLAAVEALIETMGLPEGAADRVPSPAETFPRRLYRNPDGAKVGGVCNGIATFFDIDPVWVRLGMFLPLMLLVLTAPFDQEYLSSFFGVSLSVVFMLYFLLWFIVPPASTPRQRLEMRGERITADSIRHDMRKEFSGRGTPPQVQRSASVWAEIVLLAGRVILVFIKAVAAVIGLALVAACLALIFSIAIALFAAEKIHLWNNVALTELMPGLAGITPEAYAAITVLLVLIPVVMATLLLFKLIFEGGPGGKTFTIMGGIWLITAIFWGVITIKNIEQINEGIQSAHDGITLTLPSGEPAALPETAEAIPGDTIILVNTEKPE